MIVEYLHATPKGDVVRSVDANRIVKDATKWTGFILYLSTGGILELNAKDIRQISERY
jgi:hypothetical protein